MIVKTHRSTYIFSVRNGEIHMLHGMREYLVPQMPKIAIGNPMQFVAYQLGMYSCIPSDEETYFGTSSVESVKM